MIRTQVQLRPEQHERLRRIAHQKRISFSEALRRAVDAGLRARLDAELGSNGAELLLGLAGVAESGLGDLGREHDRYLDEGEG